jgi:UDP-N-acetylmuramate dehydrogenase
MSYDMTSLDNFFQAQFPGRAKRDEPLAAHSSAGVGGPADFFVELQSSEEAEHLIYFCVQSRIPLLVIGNGSNLLFTDHGVRGIVASMGSKLYRLEEQHQDSALVVIDAGMTWADLVREMAQQGWGGLEFGAGIPGTLGGAIVTNAGAHNEEIGRHVQWVEVLDARGSTVGDEETFALPQLRRYTQAELQLEIILRLAVSAYKEDQQHIEQRLAQFRGSHRREIGTFAGHVGPLFKDPLGMKASQVIEQAGRKGLRRGKVQVSARNANFLVNLGGARASEMTSMIVEIHQQVLSRMGIDLEVDIELYGA